MWLGTKFKSGNRFGNWDKYNRKIMFLLEIEGRGDHSHHNTSFLSLYFSELCAKFYGFKTIWFSWMKIM